MASRGDRVLDLEGLAADFDGVGRQMGRAYGVANGGWPEFRNADGRCGSGGFQVGWSHVGAEHQWQPEFDEFAAGETRAFAIQPELQEVGHASSEAMLGPVQSIGQFVSGESDLVPFRSSTPCSALSWSSCRRSITSTIVRSKGLGSSQLAAPEDGGAVVGVDRCRACSSAASGRNGDG